MGGEGALVVGGDDATGVVGEQCRVGGTRLATGSWSTSAEHLLRDATAQEKDTVRIVSANGARGRRTCGGVTLRGDNDD